MNVSREEGMKSAMLRLERLERAQAMKDALRWERLEHAWDEGLDVKKGKIGASASNERFDSIGTIGASL